MQNAASKVSVITNLEDLLAVKDDWQRLRRTGKRCTPFQAPGWLIPFVRIFSLGAFGPHYGNLGPGNLMILRVIEFALRAGCHSFDFLRGQESYKYRWGARDRQTWIRKIFLSKAA